jgi:hypothetical protein
LTNLRYADDVAKFSRSATELQTIITRGNQETKQVGLKMNIGKCVVVFNDYCDEDMIEIEGRTLEKV